MGGGGGGWGRGRGRRNLLVDYMRSIFGFFEDIELRFKPFFFVKLVSKILYLFLAEKMVVCCLLFVCCCNFLSDFGLLFF